MRSTRGNETSKAVSMAHPMACLVVAAACLLGFGSNTAYAYIDPGTGSSLFSSLGMILAVAATGIAIGFAQVKRCGYWLIARISCRREGKHNPPSESAES